MRNFNKEQVEHDTRVSRANAKVEAMERLIARMHPGSPGLPAARLLLDQMRRTACEAEMNRSIFRYDEAGIRDRGEAPAAGRDVT